MTEELDHKTFDLMAVLSGRDYPTLDVPVYFNETIGLKLYQADQERKQAAGAKLAKLDDEIDALKESAKSEEYTVKLKSIPESVRRDVFNSVLAEFPTKKDVFGREEQHPEADEAFTRKMWNVYIVEVIDPTGAVSAVDEGAVTALYKSAPASVHEAINQGIAELQLGPKSAFESLAKEANFLSDASPEG